MSGKKKHKKGAFSQQLRNEIVRVFKDNPSKSFNYKQIAGLLKVSDKATRMLVFDILNEMARDGRLVETQRGKYKLGNARESYLGRIESSRKGAGYFVSEELDTDLFIPAKYMNGAIHGDEVEAMPKRSRSKNGKPEGEVIKVLNRSGRIFIGVLEVQENHGFLVPSDPRIAVDIFIPKGKLGKAVDGEMAVAKITDWPTSAKNPFGEIVEVLGKPASNDAEMKSILMANGIPIDFPDEVIAESQLIDMSLPKGEILNRRDFRDILTMTIDPVDAKDFDDAISLEILGGDKYRIGVHIADVGHYVKEGSALDKEAMTRGNSVYLVDRVIPMLPEHLSNGVCSLRPNEEKFTFSAVFEMNKDGEVLDKWFGKTVICSARRFTYEEAQERIETGEGDLAEEIKILDSIAKILRDKRIRNGALEVQSSEIRFELDDKGMPINVYKKTTKDSNKLVEEYMLLANRSVGHFVGDVTSKNRPAFVYRVHDKPDRQKVEQFRVFVSKFGKDFKFNNERDIAKAMNHLFKEFEGEPEYNMIQQMAIKSMAKAEYDTENIGHYGLGFDYYVHFTSPIRRYADLLVHRILFEKLNHTQKHHQGLSDVARHISITERRAVEAERTSRKYFQAKFLEEKQGEIFKGSITGLTEWGIYVELEENYCEGMVSLKSLSDDKYYFDEKNYVVLGLRSGNEFNIGDTVFVKVVKVNLARKQIDLEILD